MRTTLTIGRPGHIVFRTLIAKPSARASPARARVDETGLAQSTVSEHLRILKAAGIITGEIERPRVCYSLNPMALQAVGERLDELGAC